MKLEYFNQLRETGRNWVDEVADWRYSSASPGRYGYFDCVRVNIATGDFNPSDSQT